MDNKAWKEWMKTKPLEVQLLWLIDSYERYLKESHEKWESLRNASLVSDNFREAVDYSNREADGQRERYEWLLDYIANNYIDKNTAGEKQFDYFMNTLDKDSQNSIYEIVGKAKAR